MCVCESVCVCVEIKCCSPPRTGTYFVKSRTVDRHAIGHVDLCEPRSGCPV